MDPDPRRRRKTRRILIAVLALLALLGGMGAAWALTRSDDPDPSSAREEPPAAEPADERPTAEAPDDASEEEQPAAEQPAGPPLLITVRETVSVGTPAAVVDSIGRLRLGSSASLPEAIRAFGDPDESGAGQDTDPDVCSARWDDLGLRASFYFGHPPSAERSCSDGPLSAFVATGPRWRTAPARLVIGDDEARIRTAYPDARREVLNESFAQYAGAESGYLLEEGAYGGDLFPILYATVADGKVAAFVYVSLAD